MSFKSILRPFKLNHLKTDNETASKLHNILFTFPLWLFLNTNSSSSLIFALTFHSNANIIKSKLNNLQDKMQNNKNKTRHKTMRKFLRQTNKQEETRHISLPLFFSSLSSLFLKLKGFEFNFTKMLWDVCWGRNVGENIFSVNKNANCNSYTHKHYITRNFIVHFLAKCYDMANNFF